MLSSPQRKASSVRPLLEAGPLAWSREVGPGVLVTLVHTEGSCYQKAGAQLYMSKQGAVFGLVSGGCLEQAILEAAAMVLSEKLPVHLETYDSRGPDDLDFGYGMGCGGKLWVLFEPIDSFSDLEAKVLGPSREQHAELVVIAASDPGLVGSRHSLLSSDASIPWLGHPLPELRRSQSQLLTVEDHEGAKRTCVVYQRPARMVLHIFGAGPGSWPLAEMGRSLGWEIAIHDHRPQLLEDVPEHLARKHLFSREGHDLQLPPDSLRAAVLMTHSFAVDRMLLAQLLGQSWSYIGLMGSEHRCRTLLEALQAEGHPTLTSKLHGPAGLPLGGRDPASIALAILSEIQTLLHPRSHASLKREAAVYAAP